MSYSKNYTYEYVFEHDLGLQFDEKLKSFVKGLEKEGHTEKSIVFAIAKTRNEIAAHIGKDDFFNVLEEQILLYSWDKNDERWNRYNKKQSEIEKICKFVASHKLSLHSKNDGYLMFVQGDSGGTIKIEFAFNPDNRLKILQKSSHDILKILAIKPSNCEESLNVRKKFKDIKINGTWFKPETELLNFIELIKNEYSL